jgi:hypothetical protein
MDLVFHRGLSMRRGGRGASGKVGLIWLAVLLVASPCAALEMVYVNAEGIGQVLFLKNCQNAPNKKCAEFEKQVYLGDAERLRQHLRTNRVAEVWLDTGGGHSIEGQRIGKVLREYRMAVRVPKGANCASACTVAFLGGVIRTVDEGAHYLVHARSNIRDSVPEDEIARYLTAPAGELERYVFAQRKDSRGFVAERLQYIQEMVGGAPNYQRYASLQNLGMNARPPYLDSPEFVADVARINAEGRPAVHSVLMTLERASVEEALANLQPYVQELGPRAPAAWRMMETMFSTAIIRTADLSPEALVKLGFVTPIIGK